MKLIKKEIISPLIIIFVLLGVILILNNIKEDLVATTNIKEIEQKELEKEEDIQQLGNSNRIIEYGKRYDIYPVDVSEQPIEQQLNLVKYEGPIEHIFFHPLIVYPELAFDNDEKAQGYDDYFVTIKEFNQIITALYENNYILINISDIYENQIVDGQHILKKKELFLPENKKPLIISIDDLNYYEYMKKNGNAYKLIINSTGQIATYSVSPAGEEIISRTNEIVPLLDDFVQQHSDFSFQGAKGIIALTGYEGILGYRTDKLDSPSFAAEKEAALEVVEQLKKTGWVFASHGYGHLNARKISYSLLASDTERWKREVESLIGPTDIYIYPFGASVVPPAEKFQYLVDSGFPILFSVGPAPYLKMSDSYIMMDRRHIDGIALRTQRNRLLNLFDSNLVIDSVRP